MERKFMRSADSRPVFGENPSDLVGKVSRRTLLPGELIPNSAIHDKGSHHPGPLVQAHLQLRVRVDCRHRSSAAVGVGRRDGERPQSRYRRRHQGARATGSDAGGRRPMRLCADPAVVFCSAPSVLPAPKRGSRTSPTSRAFAPTNSSATASSSGSTEPVTTSATAPFTQQSIQAMLDRMGVNIRGSLKYASDAKRRRRHGDGRAAAVCDEGIAI